MVRRPAGNESAKLAGAGFCRHRPEPGMKRAVDGVSCRLLLRSRELVVPIPKAGSDVVYHVIEFVARGVPLPEDATQWTDSRTPDIGSSEMSAFVCHGVSAVSQTDPPRVEMKGFKLTHLEGVGGAVNPPEVWRMRGLYGEHTQGARTRSNIEFGPAALADPQDCAGIGAQSEHGPGSRPGSGARRRRGYDREDHGLLAPGKPWIRCSH